MNRFCRKIIAGTNSVINVAVMVFLVILLIIGCYAVWDTTILNKLGKSDRWEAYRPSENNQMSFDELRAINPEVIGWINIYGTGIDYPVVRHEGKTSYYINRAPNGKPSIIGSIFMDSRSDPHFTDYTSIIYGHLMEAHAMFGDIALFKKASFFDEHLYGNLFFDGKDHGLRIIACIETDSSDMHVYLTGNMTAGARQKYFEYIKGKSMHWRETAYDPNQHLVVMSTCSSEAFEARTLVIAELTDEVYENPFDTGFEWPGVDDLKGWLGFPWTAWFAALVVLLLIIAYILWQVDKKKKKKDIDTSHEGKSTK